MKWVKVIDDLPLAEVVEILSSLSELDVLISVEKERHDGEMSFSSDWTAEDKAEKNEEKLRSLLLCVRHFLETLSESQSERMKEPQMIEALIGLMTFIHEAIAKVEKYTPLFKRDKSLASLSDLQEFRDLEEYYASAIAPHIKVAESSDSWEDLWGVKGMDLSDARRRGLATVKDLCSDKFYDLLYLMQEDGRPFYDYDMLKKTHMLYEIDRSISVEEIEGLFYKVCIVEDRRSHLRAQHLLKTCSYLVDEFFKEALKFKESQCVSSLASGIIALMIACNPRNLKQTTSSEKTCEHYFYDFIHYMRLCLSSEEYQKLIAISHERRPFQATLYLLIHKLIFALFTEPLEQKEMIALLRRMVSEGLQDIKGEKKGSFKEQDRAIRGYLSKYSAGALHKLSELFERGDNAKGFDPLLQHNLPEGLFFFTQNEKTIECVKIPSFCKQHYIHKAELIKEFDALMRSFNIGSKHERLLYVGVQDRTSWQDYARCTVLEEASKKEDYYKNITLFCLAKHTDFYHQSSEFADVSQAETFIGIFEEQVMGKEMCGFYISEPLQGACNKWLKPILQFVHGAFFNENLTLTREERFAFIDITYLYLIAMALEASMATLITFSDKDAVDTAAGQSALWYGLCALTSGASMSEEERGALLYLLYSPALLLRERAVNEVVASRVYGALDKIQKGYRENKKYIEKKIGALPFAKLKA